MLPLMQLAVAAPTGQQDLHALAAPNATFSFKQAYTGCDDDGCWPTFYLMGAQKSATTSLWTKMINQRLVCSADLKGTEYEKCTACDGKETHFFTSPREPDGSEMAINGHIWEKENFLRSDYTILWKKQVMEQKGCERFIEATPAMQHRTAALRMFKFIPGHLHSEVRIVLLLREPISRDLSWYNHQVDDYNQGLTGIAGLTKLPPYDEYVAEEEKVFQRCVKLQGGDRIKASEHCFTSDGDPQSALVWGMYETQVKRVLRHWDRKQVFIAQMEAMLDHTEMYLKGMYGFLGMDPSRAPSTLPDDNSHDSASKVTVISCKTKESLSTIFSEMNEKLYVTLRGHHEAGKCPSGEPHFGTFPDLVKCQ